ncbi:MAG: pyridoxamine 5'-phosphate oxidase family protein [Acidimicrobiia bacterium]|nr:pyridoxamine 5'-phosphate oxidase family protein [Acidimicrobiia bacterium]
MADTDMTTAEAEDFLADLHVGILSIARSDKGPLALPIWYQYMNGEVVISMSASSVKAILLRRHGRATLTVQNETPPYQYVMVEGPVTLQAENFDILGMATRYLGDEFGKWYAENNPSTDETLVARLRPERWLTCDYGKSGQ